METPRRALMQQLVDYLSGLRFPWLLAVTAGIFLVDLFVPDCIPFADEIVLGLLAAVLATLKKRRTQSALEGRSEPAEPPSRLPGD